MNRRRFLTGTAAAVGAMMAGNARGAAWGESDGIVAPLAKGTRAERVLEVFAVGGMALWEGFYTVPEFGHPDDPDHPSEQWHLFADQHQSWFGDACGIREEDWVTPFALDANNVQVNLGPLCQALKSRPDILARTRMMVQRHDLLPHPTAAPLAQTGLFQGSDRMAGMGAHVGRYFSERDTSGSVLPYAYVLYPEFHHPPDPWLSLRSVGRHPSANRPLDIRVGQDDQFLEALERAEVGSRTAAFDALLEHYSDSAWDRYSVGRDRVRSHSLGDYSFASKALSNAPALREILEPSLFELLTDQEVCSRGNLTSSTITGLKLAAHLLNHPSGSARHVTWIDIGISSNFIGPDYDSHDEHLLVASHSVTHLLDVLVSIINEPGENDPSKVNLDDTMVVINSEFGRTPTRQEDRPNGTNHWPYGYVNLFIGGPITEDQAGVAGAIGPDARATDYITPLESRAGLLAAMGIHPFSEESFGLGELREDFESEADGLAWLKEVVLGHPA